MKCYRIVEIKNGKPHSLFHGTDGSREIPMNRWVDANIKTVHDGSCGTEYESGFHILLSAKEALEFFNKMFRIKENRIVIKCYAKGLRKKSHSKRDVYLADKIMIKDITPIREITQSG